MQLHHRHEELCSVFALSRQVENCILVVRDGDVHDGDGVKIRCAGIKGE